ncbi:MAG: hypothetical protein OEV49_07585 [candidate division Zixibacteria bacterium]|nr:hypothetical protein [candidate division Zixibacteria bacterium]MDH3890933.1 hypothetical protein [candidate division Zixibacteria bacterium]MDH3936072.1 hypothetical protein [candidate division Zixibacteria bacterium]
MRRCPIVLAILLALCGCATTSMHSRRNREFRDAAYKNLLVIAAFGDLSLQEALERKIRDELALLHVRCEMGHEVIFPGKSYTAEEYSELIDSLWVRGVLIITSSGSGYSKTYIPPSTRTKTKGTATRTYGGGFRYNEKSKTTTSGGYNIHKPWASFVAELYDVNTGEPVWYATASTRGNAFANFKNVVRSMGEKTVTMLAKDSLLIR